MFSMLRVSSKAKDGWASDASREKFIRDQAVWMRRQRFSQVKTLRPTHSFEDWWPRWGKTNPELFQQLPDGRRGPLVNDPQGKRVSMCVSEPGVWARIVEDWRKRGGDKAGSAIECGENDTPGMCCCPRCRAWDAPDPRFATSAYWSGKRIPDAKNRFPEVNAPDQPSLSDRYARYYLAVQKEAERFNPSVIISGFAYANYAAAPKQTRLNERIYISIVPEFSFPWTAEKRKGFRDQWGGWASAGASLLLRPNYTLAGHNMPIFYGRKLAEDFTWAAARGMKGTDFDSLLGAWGAQGPTLYALGRVHVRPMLKPEEILDEYYSAFGPAKSAVARYFGHWEQVSDSVTSEEFQRYWDEDASKFWLTVLDRVFTPEVMKRGRELLAQAQAAAKGDALAEKRAQYLDMGLRDAELTLATQAAFRAYKEKPGDMLRFDAYRAALRALADFRAGAETWNIANYGYLAMTEWRVWDASLLRVKLGDRPLPLAWKFQWDPKNEGESGGWSDPKHDASGWLEMGVNEPWEKQAPGKAWRDAHGQDYDGMAWYRTEFTLEPGEKGKRVSLVFGAVDESVTVWVNGRKVLTREYEKLNNPNAWMEPFSVEVTEAVNRDAPNVVAARVEDRSGQGGIWKPVWLSVADPPSGKINLAKNPGFEQAHLAPWSLLADDPKALVAKLDTAARTGDRCVRIECAADKPGRLTQKVPADKAATYSARVFVKTSPAFTGRVTLNVEGRKASEGNTQGGWRELKVGGIKPSQAGALYVAIWLRGAGAVWLDDVEVAAE
ncbi:MAG TPA: DUF4838 domain-containing protein [Candidatus Brocadiia bacterium]|nr:DUF4838 domain-containing protein [Candidatus Brocadiia bacterium]